MLANVGVLFLESQLGVGVDSHLRLDALNVLRGQRDVSHGFGGLLLACLLQLFLV